MFQHHKIYWSLYRKIFRYH